MRQEPDIDKVLSALFREPWYKRPWSWLTSSKAPMVTEYVVHGNTGIFDPIPYTVEQAPISLEHVAIVDKPLTDSDLQKASEDLDRVLRLPWYKRIPALILWLWRLP